jgi:3-methyl-2-oxobutanoate hydroxymethyltransferase
MNINDFQNKKSLKQKISMVTCYDYTFAKIINETPIDCILVGDSLAMVMHGYETTLNADTSLMALHTRAVANGARSKFIIGDLPFLSYRSDLKTFMDSVKDIMQAGAHAVKLEGADGNLAYIKHCVESGVPVMGHLGLTPQAIHQLGGFKVQGKEPEAFEKIYHDALALEKAGCFSIVLECVPAPLSQKISQDLKIPTIGIGAGSHTDGQVLVLQDLLGMNENFKPKFLRKYLDGAHLIRDALAHFHEDVGSQNFPLDKESYL